MFSFKDINYRRNGFRRLDYKKTEQAGVMLYLGYKFLSTLTRASLLAESLLEGENI